MKGIADALELFVTKEIVGDRVEAEQDEDEGIKCFTGIKNALIITAVIAAVIFIAIAMWRG